MSTKSISYRKDITARQVVVVVGIDLKDDQGQHEQSNWRAEISAQQEEVVSDLHAQRCSTGTYTHTPARQV